MPLPTRTQLYQPIIETIGARGQISLSDLVHCLRKYFKLSDEVWEMRVPTGERAFYNRVRWALLDLRRNGLVQRAGRGVYALTEEAQERFQERQTIQGAGPESTETPEEQIGAQVEVLEQELLERVRQLSPQAFEQLVLELLKAMGYGARGEGLRVGRSGDQGVDVEIAEDALGLERIYVQAKRYGPGSSVGSSELRNFVGSLDMRGMNKGVFITSGTFAPGAREVAQRTSRRVVLIDGEELVRLMRDYGVGVRPRQTIVLHRLDEDFFSQLEEEA